MAASLRSDIDDHVEGVFCVDGVPMRWEKSIDKCNGLPSVVITKPKILKQ